MGYNGASLGGVIFSPLWSALIAGIGFVHATLAIGGVMVVAVVVLSVVVFRQTPESILVSIWMMCCPCQKGWICNLADRRAIRRRLTAVSGCPGF